MRATLLTLVALSVISTTAALTPDSAEPAEPAKADAEWPSLDSFDHDAHEELAVDCVTCHVKKGKAELIPDPCGVCHEKQPQSGIPSRLE